MQLQYENDMNVGFDLFIGIPIWQDYNIIIKFEKHFIQMFLLKSIIAHFQQSIANLSFECATEYFFWFNYLYF